MWVVTYVFCWVPAVNMDEDLSKHCATVVWDNKVIFLHVYLQQQIKATLCNNFTYYQKSF